MEVSARLTRLGSVYLGGEEVEVEVLVSRPDGGGPTPRLAWASVQLHCHEQLNLHKLRVPETTPAEATASPVTSFVASKGEKGLAIFASRPNILFCDLELRPGQTRRFCHTETLPAEGIPPSFRGHAVKYVYKMTVGVQDLHSAVRLIRLPLRVLVLPGLSHVCLEDAALRPANPFLAKAAAASTLDLAASIIDSITNIPNPQRYTITTPAGRVGTLALPRNSFKLGDDVLGSLDFEDADVPCVQFCASLELVEEVAEEYRIKQDQMDQLTTLSKQHCVALALKKCQIKLPIPLTATPSFFTNIVHLKWRVHFEFVTTNCPKLKQDASESGGLWEAPRAVDIETMVWDLPIKVFPANPLLASLGSSLNHPHAPLTL